MTAGRGVKPSSLIDRAIDLVKGFNPATQTVDSYADDTVEAVNADSSDSVFLKQVCVYGRTRTSRLINHEHPHWYFVSHFTQQMPCTRWCKIIVYS